MKNRDGAYLWMGTSGSGEDIRKGVGGEYGGNAMYSCMKMEK
jgi:hypothetical protein